MLEEAAAWNNRMYGLHKTPYEGGLASWIQRSRLRFIFHMANIKREDRVLEIGCEAGTLIFALPPCHQAVGFDISTAALSDAEQMRKHRLLDHVTFLQGDAELKLPFEQGAFDLILCSEMLEHVRNPIAVVENIHALCTPSTRVLITLPIEGPKLVLKKILDRFGLFALVGAGVERGHSEWHLQDFSRRQAIALLRTNFVIKQTRTVWGCHWVFLLEPRQHSAVSL